MRKSIHNFRSFNEDLSNLETEMSKINTIMEKYKNDGVINNYQVDKTVHNRIIIYFSVVGNDILKIKEEIFNEFKKLYNKVELWGGKITIDDCCIY